MINCYDSFIGLCFLTQISTELVHYWPCVCVCCVGGVWGGCVWFRVGVRGGGGGGVGGGNQELMGLKENFGKCC